MSICASGALAQGEPSTDYTEFGLDELLRMDLVYGASRYEQKVADAPAAVTVITCDEICEFGYRTLGEVLASVPGFYTTYDRSYEYVGVRGFGRPGDYNTRVLLLVDGHVLNDLIYNQAPVGNESPVDLEDVERIEIIRGPGSALYGNGAFFAVVNVVTRGDGGDEGGEAAVEAGSRGRLGARAAWSGGTGDGDGISVSASGFRGDGEDLYWPEYDDPATNHGVFAGGDAESVLRIGGRAHRGGLALAAAYSERTKGVPTAEWDMLFNDDGAEIRDSRLVLDAVYERELGAENSLRARAGYDRAFYRGEYPYDYAAPGDPQQRVITTDEGDGRWLSAALLVEKRHGRHRLVAGGDLRKALMARQESRDPFAMLLDVDERVDNAGAYVQDEVRLGNGLSLYAGLRWDTYTSFGGHATPRLGLVTRPGDSSTLKLMYGGAFRAPNAYELYYGDGSTQKGNPRLDPEHIATMELVFEQDLGSRVKASASLYWNEIHDLIDQVVDPADSLITFANLTDVCTNGFECTLDARLLADWRGRAGWTWQRTTDETTDQELTNSPRHIAQAGLMTPRLGGLLSGSVDLRHLSRRKTLSGGSVDAYTVADLTLRLEPGVTGLHVDVTVRNLFDTAYADPGAEHQRQDSLAREGRRIDARITCRW